MSGERYRLTWASSFLNYFIVSDVIDIIMPSSSLKLKVPFTVFAFIFFSTTCWKPNLEKKNYSSKFFHNFHLSESSFTCPRVWESGIARRLLLALSWWKIEEKKCLLLILFLMEVVSVFSRSHWQVMENLLMSVSVLDKSCCLGLG